MNNVIDVASVICYYSGMAKLITNPEQLRAHLDRRRLHWELDGALAKRLGIHVNTVTKLKHYGAAFDTPEVLKKLGLRVVYEVVK